MGLLDTRGEWDRAPKSGYAMMKVKRQFIANMGNTPGSQYGALEKEDLIKKLEYCKEYLELLEKFYPGNSYIQAGILYEAVATATYLLRLDPERAEDLKKEIKSWVKEVKITTNVEQQTSPFYQLRKI